MKIKKLFEHIIRTRKYVFKRNKGSLCDKPDKPPPDPGPAWKPWRTLSIGFAVPMVIVGTLVNIILLAMCGEMTGPPFVPYEYMYRRVRRFPWGEGDKSFFHNPDANALPNGYEQGRGPTRRYSEELDGENVQEEDLTEAESQIEAVIEDEEEEVCKCK